MQGPVFAHNQLLLRIEPQRLLGFDITAGDAEERRILPLPEVWCKLFLYVTTGRYGVWGRTSLAERSMVSVICGTSAVTS